MKRSYIGIYITIIILLYALIGGMSFDIYVPTGRRIGGHLLEEAIPPAMLSIALFALAFFVGHLKESKGMLLARRLLLIGSGLSMLWAFYFVAFPTGQKTVTTEQCQATFAKLSAYLSPTGEGNEFFVGLASECESKPMSKVFYECVERARRAEDTDQCDEEAQWWLERKNSSKAR